MCVCEPVGAESKGQPSPGCGLSSHSVLDLLGPGDTGKAKGPLPSLLHSIFNSSEGTGAPPDFSLPHLLLGARLPEAIQGAYQSCF